MQMTIRMPDEYRERLERMCQGTGLKKSDIARLALKKFLEDYEGREQDEDRPAARAVDLIGVSDSGISDLGSNHRRHLLKRMQK